MILTNFIYDVPGLEGDTIKTYSLTRSDYHTIHIAEEAKHDYIGFVTYKYVQADLLISNSFRKPTLASFCWAIGGFLSLVISMSNIYLANYKSFAIDKSLTKRIFSSK